jgi:SAM-dependent methyltransferase
MRQMAARYPPIRRAGRWAFRRFPSLNRLADRLLNETRAHRQYPPTRRDGTATVPSGDARQTTGGFASGSYFNEPLVDLGEYERQEFAGLLSPRSEAGTKREGVNEVFLGNAEDYYQRYQGYDYWKSLLMTALRACGEADPALVVEFGCGFGNATLPALELMPKANIIATDISPNLLAILNRLLHERGFSGRCAPIAMDAQKHYLRREIADLVFGAAVLHHLADPGSFVCEALRILKPGKPAFFFEPLEGGHAILRLICQNVVDEAKRRNQFTHPVTYAQTVAESLEPQIFRAATPGWRDRDDKWVFSRAVLDRIAEQAGAQVAVYPLHDNNGQFSRSFAYMLQTYGGIPRDSMPGWVWDIFDRYDRKAFSPEMLIDLAMEGCIIFRKRS